MGNLWSVIGVFRQSLRQGRLPPSIVLGPNGEARIRCRACSSSVTLERTEEGAIKCVCPVCGGNPLGDAQQQVVLVRKPRLVWSKDDLYPAESLTPAAVKQANDIVTDSRLALAVGLIPILGLIYAARLIQWYGLRRRYPELVSTDAGEHADLARRFRGARWRLWFAVLLSPAVILLYLVLAR